MAGEDASAAAPWHAVLLPQGRLRHWAVTLGKFGAVQIVVQALGALSGILVVRHLSKGDYALFTIANSMQGTMNLLADSGVSVALMAVGGKVWQDPCRLGELIHTALQMRRQLAAFVVAAVVPLLVWLLVHNGAGAVYTMVLVAAVVTGLSFQLGLDVHIVVPRLHSQVTRLQRLDLGAATLRLGILATFFLLYLDAGVAVWVATAGVAWQLSHAKRWAKERIAPDARGNDDDRREVGRKIRHLLPTALFYCLQGQIVVFLLSLTGKSGQVAEVGALGRLTVLLGVLNPIMSGILLPAFSRCVTRADLLAKYWKILGAYLLICGGLVAGSMLFAGPMLWVLGSRYSHLEHELTLMTLNTAIGLFTGTMWSLNASRGWVHHVWLEIPFRLGVQAGLIFVLDLSTVSGVLWFSILPQFVSIPSNSILTLRGICRMPVGPTVPQS